MHTSIEQPLAHPSSEDVYKPVFQEDEEGYLFDCGFRDLLTGRGIDREQVAAAEALRSVVVAGKVVSQRFEENLSALGVTHPQFRTLMAIRYGSADGIQMHRIAVWLGVTPRNVTGIVDALEGQGLVTRDADPADRRAFKVRMTPAGEAVAAAALKINKADQKEVLGALSPAETKQLRHLCMKLIRAVKESAAGTEVR
ncbi:MAG TPA: MarR family transcriptional regulator [Candidatus Dormibacteraeota bacterium]|nr:MarR family transcriptional regulator [Candidatus Dormibacteraeota bacterium]